MSNSVGMFSIGGMASGLDTENMIASLMELERAPIQRIEQRQAELGQADEAWNDILTKLSSLRGPVDALSDPDAFDQFVDVTSTAPDAVAATPDGSAETGALTFEVEQLATSHQLASGVVADPDADLGGGQLQLTIGDDTHEIVLEPGGSLHDLADQLRAEVDGLDVATVPVGDDGTRLLLEGHATGADNAIEVDSDLAPFADTELLHLQDAQDAQLTVGGQGGLLVERSSNHIDDLVPGADITLQATTVGPVTVSAERDDEAAVGAVAGYVDAINGVLATIDDHSNYNVQAEQGGVLQGDSTARRIAADLRSAVTADPGLDPTEPYAAAYQIGLEVDRHGELTLDGSVLRDALADDPDAVARLISGDGDEVDGLTGAMDGVLSAAEGSGGAIASARQGIEGQIDLQQDRIDAIEHRLISRESTLRGQFTAMETALQQLQSQGDWLAGQLAGLGGGAPQQG